MIECERDSESEKEVRGELCMRETEKIPLRLFLFRVDLLSFVTIQS